MRNHCFETLTALAWGVIGLSIYATLYAAIVHWDYWVGPMPCREWLLSGVSLVTFC